MYPLSTFYANPRKSVMRMRWKQALSKKESFRGAIRGASHRERLLHPSPAKAVQRRIRSKLLRSYALRFGQDEFFAQMNFWKELPRPGGRFWIRKRFAHWKVRLPGTTLMGATCSSIARMSFSGGSDARSIGRPSICI